MGLLYKSLLTFLIAITIVMPVWANKLDMYHLAAARGDARAQYNLGVIYYNGEGVPHNYKEAVKWYYLAAAQGDARAQYNLGAIYHNGAVVPQNYKEAVKCYRLAAAQGHVKAQFRLGVMYNSGEGVSKNKVYAYMWLNLAVASGDEDASEYKDIMVREMTAPEYHLAAARGDARAQYNLGYMYSKGEGVPRDYKEAVKWYRLAAAQGDARAQYNLGHMYSKGEGVPVDKVYAYMWWNLSAASGSEDASKNKDIIINSMTPSQVKKAQGLSKACLKSSYKHC